DFPAVAASYRLMEDDSVAVLVTTWEEKREEVAALLEAGRRRPNRANFRKLNPFQVNLRRYKLAAFRGAQGAEQPRLELFVWRGGYDRETGLTAENADTLLIV